MSVDCKTVWANLITGDIRGAPVSSSWQQLRPGCASVTTAQLQPGCSRRGQQGGGHKTHEVEARGAAAAANNVVQFRLLDIYICPKGSVKGKRCMLMCSKTRM